MKSFILASILAGAVAGAAHADRLPEEDLGEMAAGRMRLLAVAEAGAAAPMLLARAESGFDCWTAAIEAAGAAEAAACRTRFLDAVAALESGAAARGNGLMAAR